MMQSYYAVGLMSGTSMDGVDLVLCQFRLQEGQWKFNQLKSGTYPYGKEMTERIKSAHLLPAFDFLIFHKELGTYLGELVNNFLKGYKQKIDLIGSHGHTIFHRPDLHLTFQAGDGQMLANTTGIPVVCDFRSCDVALGGQGAPLVPVGDELLFKGYDFCLNLGGFANVSYNNGTHRIAFDICPVNLAANYLSNLLGKEFDKDGTAGMKGVVQQTMLDRLNELPFYTKPAPKSLGREWFESEFLPIIAEKKFKPEDRLRTLYEHIAIQVGKILPGTRQKSVLVTGGGGLNKYLVKVMSEHTRHQLVVPVQETVEFKEAIIFGFLGILRLRNEINCLASVTGASKDSSCGIIYYP